MSLVNNSANNFKDFLDAIKPYLNYQFYDLSGQGVEANNFSTDEKVIGTWIDGKPLYQKTVSCGALPNNTFKQIEHNISNLDKIVYINGISFKNDSSKETKPVSFASTSGSMYNISADAYADYIYITTGSDRTGFHGYVTLRYTKTTDTAVASGEKIVGQWIDGKPVYEKTLSINTPTSTTEESHSIGASIDKAISINATIITPYGTNYCGSIYAINSFEKGIKFFVETNSNLSNPNSLGVYVSQDSWMDLPCYVTLRYTKTT